MRRRLSQALNDRLFSGPALSEAPGRPDDPVRTPACPTDEQLVDHALGLYFLPEDQARHTTDCEWCAYVQRLAREESAPARGVAAWPNEAAADPAAPAAPRWPEAEDAEYDEAVVTSGDLSAPRGQQEMKAGREQLQEAARSRETPATEPLPTQG